MNPSPALSQWWLERGIPLPLEAFAPFWERLDRGEPASALLAEAPPLTEKDPFVLLDAADAREEWVFLEKRKERLLTELEEHGKLTPVIREAILAETHLPRVEDHGLPLRPKVRSRAALARDAGLQPFADWIWDCAQGTLAPEPGQTLEIWGYTFRNEKAGFGEIEKVLEGGRDLLVERFSEDPELRDFTRSLLRERGEIRVERSASAKRTGRYDSLIGARDPVSALLEPDGALRYALCRKGWVEEELTLSFASSDAAVDLFAACLARFEGKALRTPGSPGEDLLRKAAEVALRSHVWTAMEAELHRALKDNADRAIARNAAHRFLALVSRKPLGPQAILGLHAPPKAPARLVAADPEGKLLAETSFRFATPEERASAEVLLREVLANPALQGAAVGDGAASREAERFLRSLARGMKRDLTIFFVPEGGAAEAAPRPGEIPPSDPLARAALEIARRAQDPLEAARRSPDLRAWLGPYAPGEVNAERMRLELSFALAAALLPSAPKTEPFFFPGALAKLEDLRKGDLLQGLVTNVTSFGAFVDVGLPEQGLLHASRLARGRFRDPREGISAGERVEVTVLDVQLEKRQLAFAEGALEPRRPPRRAPPARPTAPPPRKAARPGGKSPPPRAPQVPFHNPFAGLASMKSQLPKKK